MRLILSAENLWTDIVAVRERSPLVHSITILVVINFNANQRATGRRRIARYGPCP